MVVFRMGVYWILTRGGAVRRPSVGLLLLSRILRQRLLLQPLGMEAGRGIHVGSIADKAGLPLKPVTRVGWGWRVRDDAGG